MSWNHGERVFKPEGGTTVSLPLEEISWFEEVKQCGAGYLEDPEE